MTDRSAVASAVKDRALSHGLDVLLYDEIIRADLSWYEPDLAGIPRGVVLGGGPIADQRMVLEHPGLVASTGIEVWQSLGMLASADFVVSDALLGDFGVRGMEVPRYRWSAHSESSESMPISSAKLIAVVALSDTRVGYASVVRDIDAEGEISKDCLVCVIAPDVRLGAESVAALIIEGAPSRLQGQIVVVPPAEDGIAWRILEMADLVVARRRTDAVSPAVRASTAPCVAPPSLEDSAAVLFDGPPPTVRSAGRGVEMVQVDGLPSTAIGAIDAAFARGAASVVLHDESGTIGALDTIAFKGIPNADLVVVGSPAGAFGEPSCRSINPGVFGIGRFAWPTVRRRSPRVGSLWELMVWMLSISSTEHASLLVVPGRGNRWSDLGTVNVTGISSWLASRHIVDRPNLASV